MKLHEIRQRYLRFFQERGHAVIPSAPIIPENDPTTLFVGSGMQPLLPYLLGEPHPKGRRLTNSQRCFRAEDIEEVGDNRHTTFFEMLGNWSLGDYFKKEQIPWFFTFLVEELKLPPERLYVTIFAGDEERGIPYDKEAEEIWKGLFASQGIEAKAVLLGTEDEGGKRGMQGGRIFAYGAEKNWWSRAGVPEKMPPGEPGGPDTEVFFEFHDVPHDDRYGKYCHPNCDCGRFMEIGNSVFMEYRKEKDGSFSRLPQKNVDFGGGLERLAAATLNTADVFQVDVFQAMLRALEEKTSLRYGDGEKETRAFRIIADHLRGAFFMIAEGVRPSNVEQGYVVRKLLRRAIRFADILQVEPGGLQDLALPLAKAYADAYPFVKEQLPAVQEAFREEERRFRKTLQRGLREFERFAQKGSLSGHDAFVLFSTYGFPLEMTRELAQERGIPFDEEGYEKEFQEHQEASRSAAAGKFRGGLADQSEKTTMLHTATHLMLAGLRKELGEHVHQAGSHITQERTRFDFTHQGKVPEEVLRRVEAYVNEAIAKGCEVRIEKMRKEEAKAAGVEGSFWEKYPDEVNVYVIADSEGNVYSRELCGGPHVKNTGTIRGTFRIVKESSSGAGVRRIKAILEE